MFYVICPRCGEPVEVPAEAVGRERTDLWNLASCTACQLSFDYDDAEVERAAIT